MTEEEKNEEVTVRLVGGMEIPKMQAVFDTSKIPGTSMPNVRLVGLPDGIEQRGAPIPKLQAVSPTSGTSAGNDQGSNVQGTSPTGATSGGNEKPQTNNSSKI